MRGGDPGRAGLGAAAVLGLCSGCPGLRQEQHQLSRLLCLLLPPLLRAEEVLGAQLPVQPSSETGVTARVPLLAGTCPFSPGTRRVR